MLFVLALFRAQLTREEEFELRSCEMLLDNPHLTNRAMGAKKLKLFYARVAVPHLKSSQARGRK